jgi:hypothetical protein
VAQFNAGETTKTVGLAVGVVAAAALYLLIAVAVVAASVMAAM